MAIPNTETLIPRLLSEWVSSRRVDLSIADAETLPFAHEPVPLTSESQCPRVIFLCTQWSSPHPRRMELTVLVELQTGAASQILATENQWTAGIRYALADSDGFKAWLQALPEESRTGFELRQLRITEGGMSLDEKTMIRGRRTEVVIHIRSDEMAPPQP